MAASLCHADSGCCKFTSRDLDPTNTGITLTRREGTRSRRRAAGRPRRRSSQARPPSSSVRAKKNQNFKQGQSTSLTHRVERKRGKASPPYWQVYETQPQGVGNASGCIVRPCFYGTQPV